MTILAIAGQNFYIMRAPHSDFCRCDGHGAKAMLWFAWRRVDGVRDWVASDMPTKRACVEACEACARNEPPPHDDEPNEPPAGLHFLAGGKKERRLMATQGIVSIVQDGKTVVKAIAGCDGFNAPLLALLCRDRRWFDIEAVHEAAQEVGFGCADCLVVMDADTIAYECEMSDEQLAFYREKFTDPHFNPRWKQGTADFAEVVEIPAELEAP